MKESQKNLKLYEIYIDFHVSFNLFVIKRQSNIYKIVLKLLSSL